MASENFSLKWNDFEKNISGGLREIRSSGEFLDVTLVCEQEQVQAHKLVLSACSTFFRNIFTRNPSPNPLIYLRGVSYADMTAVLNFMYHGEVNVAQEDLNTFLAIAEDLKVKGLTQHDNAKETREDKGADIAEKSERSANSAESPGADRKRSIKRPTEAPLQKKPRDADGHDNDVVHIKSEPTFASVESPANAISIAEVNYGRETSRAMVKPGEGGFRDDGLDMEDGLDREDGLDSHLDYSYSDYHEVSYGEGSQMSADGLSKGFDTCMLNVGHDVKIKSEEEDSDQNEGEWTCPEISCPDCGEKKKDYGQVYTCIQKHSEERKKNGLPEVHYCSICEKTFTTRKSLTQHRLRRHGQSSRPKAKSTIFKCQMCNTIYSSKSVLNRHCKQYCKNRTPAITCNMSPEDPIQTPVISQLETPPVTSPVNVPTHSVYLTTDTSPYPSATNSA